MQWSLDENGKCLSLFRLPLLFIYLHGIDILGYRMSTPGRAVGEKKEKEENISVHATTMRRT